jgi:Polysaccharide deacetylase
MHNGHRRIAHGAALAGLVAAGLAVAHAGPGVTAIGPVRRRAFPRLAGLGRPDHVALTFDDGPDPASTPAFLDLLAARRVHATFFLLGSMVARSPRPGTRSPSTAGTTGTRSCAARGPCSATWPAPATPCPGLPARRPGSSALPTGS